tara:strand:+ start:754 stop:1038 length:285 start_codon:yes stop_codon:yes gene_type:complete
MNKVYEIFRIDGSVEILVDPNLKAMQNVVGGYIEYLPQVDLPEGNGCIDVVVNEEHLLLGLLPNITLMSICNIPVTGDAIVITEKGFAEFMGEI